MIDKLKSLFDDIRSNTFVVITLLLLLNVVSFFNPNMVIATGQAVYGLFPMFVQGYIANISIGQEAMFQIYNIILLIQSILFIYFLLFVVAVETITLKNKILFPMGVVAKRIFLDIVPVFIILMLTGNLLSQLNVASIGVFDYFRYIKCKSISSLIVILLSLSPNILIFGVNISYYFCSEKEPRSERELLNRKICPIMSKGNEEYIECTDDCIFYTQPADKKSGAEKENCSLYKLLLKERVTECDS